MAETEGYFNGEPLLNGLVGEITDGHHLDDGVSSPTSVVFIGDVVESEKV
jgi:hypothetical protein